MSRTRACGTALSRMVPTDDDGPTRRKGIGVVEDGGSGDPLGGEDVANEPRISIHAENPRERAAGAESGRGHDRPAGQAAETAAAGQYPGFAVLLRIAGDFQEIIDGDRADAGDIPIALRIHAPTTSSSAAG